ncbi:hypothetical protein HNR46_001207 [Haloferula luteola]|uniref:Uncharacterized protein YfbK N-terminal domain-containing protein n=1 Tax=Haloferula luteola TaxID=595692 RepID=A0A840V0U9_9BACT|nr:von Willebrand factor type A domain-containing protein [Haloferula luteola]MBB5350973.1 hypothetical protein [Haloferula luteola]
MKLLPDDPRLTGYVLGELDEADARLVERAAASDPAIRLTLQELERTCGFLGDVLGPMGEAKLRPRQRRAVLKASTEEDRQLQAEQPKERRSRAGWMMAGAAAAVMVAAAMLGRGGRSGEGTVDAVALLPAPGPGAGTIQVATAGQVQQGTPQAPQGSEGIVSGPAFLQRTRSLSEAPLPSLTQLPVTADLGGFATDSSLRLPVVTGTGSAVWVRRWIRERGELPPRDAVRVEELVNSLTIPTRPLGDGLECGVGSMRCPWNAERMLVAVALRSRDEDSVGLTVRSLSDEPRRVVGSYGMRSDAKLPTTLPAGRSQLVLLEFSGGSDLGSIELQDGRGHQFVLRVADQEAPQEDLLRVATMAAFGLWLRHEEVSSEDLQKLLEVSRQEDPIWMDACRLIETALGLSAEQR